MKKLFLFLLMGTFLISFGSTLEWRIDLDRYYSFNETGGTVVTDFGGFGNDGAVVGTPVWVRGFLNNSLNFSDPNRVTMENFSFDNTASSINLWFNATSFGGATVFALLGSGDVDAYIYLPNSTAVQVQSDLGGDLTQFTIPSVALNGWHMITITRSAGTLRVFLNATESTEGGQSFTNPQTFTQMGAYMGTTSFFSGRLDEVSMWNRTLSLDDISDLYNLGIGLVLDEGTAPLIAINTPLGRDQTVQKSVNFSFLISPTTGVNLVNATLKIWYDNNSLFNETTDLVSGSSPLQKDFNITFIDLGNYTWNMESCQGGGRRR